MAANCLHLVIAALAGLILQAYAQDVVHSDDIAPTYEDLESTTSGYDNQIEPEQAQLTCYDCTSYMPSCKRRVTDLGGEIVSRTGCKTKCFLRVGEEQSGALYRGCMDDFITAQLTQDYVGCKVQEWNGRKSLWCLCDDDLCNGQSLKSLFYFGYGSPEKPKYTPAPEGKEILHDASTVMDTHFDDMTDSIDNYNSHYAMEPKLAEEEPLPEVSPLKEMAEATEEVNAIVDEGDQVDAGNQVDEGYQVDEPQAYENQQPYGFGPPEPSYPQASNEEFNQQQEEQVHGKEQLLPPVGYPAEPTTQYSDQHYSQQLPSSGSYMEEHHLPLPNIYPVTPEQYQQNPAEAAQPQYPGYIPYQYPMLHNNQFKYYDGEEELYPEGVAVPKEEAPAKEDEVKLKSPEGKSADLGKGDYLGEFFKFPPQDIAPYPYHYNAAPAEFEQLEPAKYFPYEENKAVEKLEEVKLEPEPKEAEPTEEPIAHQLDSELFCPSAGIFTYEEDCSKFVMCLIDHIHGRPRMYVMKCPGGLVFDNIANTCMQPENSNGCKRLTTPQPPVVETTPLPYQPEHEVYENSRLNQFHYRY